MTDTGWTMESDTCLICGRYVPEGRMVCIVCAKNIMDDDKTESGLLTEEENE